jgi:hypothetical protein
VSKKKSKKQNQQPAVKQNKGTVKRYLSEIQVQILVLLNKHLLQSSNHPISVMCELFRQEFEKAYSKYT